MYLNQSAGDANVWSHPFNAHDFESGHFCILPLKRTASPPWTIRSNPTGFFTNLTWQHFRRECFIVSKQLMQNIWTNNIYINKKSIRNIKHIYKKATNYTGKKKYFSACGKKYMVMLPPQGTNAKPGRSLQRLLRWILTFGSPWVCHLRSQWTSSYGWLFHGGQPNSPNVHPAPEIRVNSRTY